MKANSTQCSQASVPLIERTFLYKVKRKEEDSDQKTFAQKERLGTQIVTVFTLIDSPQKNDVLVFDNFTVQ